MSNPSAGPKRPAQDLAAERPVGLVRGTRDWLGSDFARLAALERVLSRDRNDPAFDPVVEKLCEVASEQTEAASTRTRAQALFM